jgi:hypothetical protein
MFEFPTRCSGAGVVSGGDSSDSQEDTEGDVDEMLNSCKASNRSKDMGDLDEEDEV